MRNGIKRVRLVACAIAASCVLFDDLPEPQYNTFHDPVSAAILSIVFANLMTLLLRRGYWTGVLIAFVPALILKFLIQALFWVRDAEVPLLGFVLVSHAVIGYLAAPSAVCDGRSDYLFSGLGGIFGALLVVLFLHGFKHSWLYFYWELAAARLLFPWCFWTGILLIDRRKSWEGQTASTKSATDSK